MSRDLKRVALLSVVGFVGLTVALFLAVGAIGFMVARTSLDPETGLLWVMGAFAVLVMVGALAVGIGWMRSIDEAAREAHKSAWYWGGSAGLAVGGVAIIMASLPQAEALQMPSVIEGRVDPAAYAATGAIGMMSLMLLGYLIAWAWWWWRRR